MHLAAPPVQAALFAPSAALEPIGVALATLSEGAARRAHVEAAAGDDMLSPAWPWRAAEGAIFSLVGALPATASNWAADLPPPATRPPPARHPPATHPPPARHPPATRPPPSAAASSGRCP